MFNVTLTLALTVKCYRLHTLSQDWAHKLQRAFCYTMMSFKPQSIHHSNWWPASMWPWSSQFVYTVTQLTENQYQIVSFLSSFLCLKWIDSTVMFKGKFNSFFFKLGTFFFHVFGFTLLIRIKFEIGVLSFNFSQHSWNGKCKCLSNFAPWLYIHAKCFFNWQAEFAEGLTTLLTGTCREIEHFSWPFAWSGLLPRAEVLWKVTCCLFVCWIG